MSADRDPRFSPANEPDDDFEDDAPRSIFSATWFRVVLVVLVLGVIGAVAIPYVLDATHDGGGTKTASAPSASQPLASSPSARPATPPPAPSTPASAPASPPPSSAVSTPAPAPKAPPVVAQAPKPEAPAPPVKEPVPETPKTPPAEKPSAAKAPAVAEKAARPTPARGNAAEGGDYFVQVGAFKDAATAKRVATRLRDQNYPVDESVKRVAGTASSAPSAAPRPAPRTASPSGPDRYDVIVSGGSASEINAKLAGKGLASEPLGDGVRIRPSLPLRDAVALSKDLGNEGFKVQVRRGGSAATEPAPATATPAPRAVSDVDAQTLYRVRVGGYPDRATALGVLRELQGKGYQPFIAKGRD